MVSGDSRSFWTGVLYLVLGCSSAYIARSYGIGTAANMGAGYVPFSVGCMLALIGGYLSIKALATRTVPEEEEGEAPASFKIILLILASILAFALLTPKMGFLVAVASMIFIAGLASGELSWKEMILLIIFLTVISTLIFVVVLGLSFNILPTYLTG